MIITLSTHCVSPAITVSAMSYGSAMFAFPVFRLTHVLSTDSAPVAIQYSTIVQESGNDLGGLMFLSLIHTKYVADIFAGQYKWRCDV